MTRQRATKRELEKLYKILAQGKRSGSPMLHLEDKEIFVISNIC